MDMEAILNDTVSQDELMKFEAKYNEEQENQNVSHGTQFEYAWCLTRSTYSPDIQKGIALLEDLCARHPEGKRDYIYYLAIGNSKIKNYSLALKYCKTFLQIEPNNQQALMLQEYVKKKSEKESLIGLAAVGAGVLAFGSALGIGVAIAKSLKNKNENDKK